MKTRSLPSQSRLKELLDYDPETGKLFWRTKAECPDVFSKVAGKEAFTAKTEKGYLRGMIKGEQFRAHRIIYKWVHDEEPEEIDHINGVRDDNRIENLRPCTRRENLLNSITSKRSKNRHSPNVLVTNSGFRAIISHNGQNRNLGTYNTPEEASAAVNGAILFMKTL